MPIFKVPFKNKSLGSNRTNKGASITGDMYFKYRIEKNFPFIEGAQLVLGQGTQFNKCQKPTTSKRDDKIRKEFKDFYNNKSDAEDPHLIKLKNKDIKWWNAKLSKGFSPLSALGLLAGHPLNGSEKIKAAAPLILSKGEYKNQPFFNLLKVFLKTSYIKTTMFSQKEIDSADSYFNFLEEISKLNEEIRYVKNNFYSTDNLYFVIKQMKEHLKIDLGNNKKRLRSQFRNNLLSTFKQKDQYYKIFTARQMVEAAHIKPFSHSENDHEKVDSNNGMWLSPDIHTLFDSGVITFDDHGNVIYSLKKNSEKFSISKEEIDILKLDEYSLDSTLLKKERLCYLEYHRKHIYQKGIKK